MAMYRGLSTFISDIRNCKTKEQETQRVDKELANVRKAFTSGKMSPYDRKKYVWKLVYCNLLGYEIDFGHMEMISLVSCPTYAEKLVGYISVAVMLKNTDEQITLVVQAIKNDLQSTQDPIQSLALCAIANIGGKELAETVAPDVQRILYSRSIFPIVRKKAALCLLRLSRISRDILPPDENSKKLVTLLEDKNLGVVLSVVTLILGLAEREPTAYEGSTGHLLVWLTRLAVQRQCSDDYVYHGTACPWLQVRLLRLLQFFPIPATEAMRVRLNEVVGHILNKTEVTKSVNRNNAEHCVLFEAVNLLIKQGEASEPVLRAKAIGHLSKFINIREPNIRYLGLEAMSRMTHLEGTGDAIRKQQATILFSLKDADVSIRRRALDLLFAMCDKSITESVVKELLNYLAITDVSIKDEMVLKIAILAERFAPSMQWYVDTVIALISLGGEAVSDDVWHRLVQIVTNTESLQQYAASKAHKALEPSTANEVMVKVGSYLLGEFGYTLADADIGGGPPVAGIEQFAVIHQHFPKVTAPTKALVLSAYVKLSNLYPELREQTGPIFAAYTSAMDAELQQRALEYSHIPDLPETVTSVVLDALPPFPERTSMLEARLAKTKLNAEDKDVWAKDGSAKGGAAEDEEDDEGSAGGDGAAARGSRAGSLDDAAAAAAAVAASSSGAAGGALDDLLGMGDALSSVSAAAPDAASVPVTHRVGIADEGASSKLFSALLTKPAGVLYEDAYVQLGVKRVFTGATGRITLFVGNKCGVQLSAFRVRVVPGGAALKAEVEGDVPSAVAAKAQVQVPIVLEAMQPFTEPPALQVSFISTPGTGHAYGLRVPVALPAFCEPIALPPADYKTRWGALAGAPKEVTAVITPGSGGGAVSMAAAIDALGRVNMSNIEAGAPGATGACTFRTRTPAPGGGGGFISVGCLAKAIPDVNGGVFKVAVRTQHADVSRGIMAVLQAHIEAL